MPWLSVGEGVRIPFQPGMSVRDILDGTDHRVRSGCSGTGACGLCLVRIEQGSAGEPTQVERLHLDHASLEEGLRLACQIIASEDLRITIVGRAPRPGWKRAVRRAVKEYGIFELEEVAAGVVHPLGIAVDLGTTFIGLSLWDLTSRRCVSDRQGVNPQAEHGSDVMTRLLSASRSEQKARRLQELAFEAIGEALEDIGLREGINLEQVVRIVLVGNTAMLTLLGGTNHELLLKPRYWTLPIDSPGHWLQRWPARHAIHPGASVWVVPSLAGFVGSDLLAGVLSTEMTEKSEGALLIDFGTNTEIALWDGKSLWVSSAAGGPAFEGAGIGCGMPAERGAIFRITLENSILAFDVVDNAEPLGLCGSGLVDLLAVLVRSGRLDEAGRFLPTIPADGFVLSSAPPGIVLTKRDVDTIQRAKAAIATGVQILMAEAGQGGKQIKRLYVGGAFGQWLDIANAQQIGLLPDIEATSIRLCGNTALAGCEDLLMSPSSVKSLERIRGCAKVVNLSDHDGFHDSFMENLYLRRMKIG
ncbi:MAG: ASKHA domain-containing protein [Syntrophobacteraceae bacterium]|nr:ASKHA domain-containing protein [Syntrophobacteraceae bacterium]